MYSNKDKQYKWREMWFKFWVLQKFSLCIMQLLKLSPRGYFRFFMFSCEMMKSNKTNKNPLICMYRGNPRRGKYSVASVYAHVHMLVFSQYWISCPPLCPLSDMPGLGLCKSRFLCRPAPWYALLIKGHRRPPERQEEEERTQFLFVSCFFQGQPSSDSFLH